ncbi:MAG: hypothetical protein MZV63_05280 [Marinilabiliales bacterium]|nr:hypothetical protein [Marinilabiliales bacterium]
MNLGRVPVEHADQLQRRTTGLQWHGAATKSKIRMPWTMLYFNDPDADESQ